MRALARDFLPSKVSIKREYLPKRAQIRQKAYAMSGLQKNPRRSETLTGIYANNLKLKYGAFSFSSNMLNIFYQRGWKATKNGKIFSICISVFSQMDWQEYKLSDFVV